MNVSLTPELNAFLERKVASGRYQTTSEVVREALRLLERQDDDRSAALRELKAKLERGARQAEHGELLDGEAVFEELKGADRGQTETEECVVERRTFDLTPEARADLAEIVLTIAEDSPRIAERIRAQLLEELRRLGRNPGIGRYREDLLSRRYRFWGFYRYVIVYAWQTKPVRIIAVLHGARDLGALMGTRG